MIDDVITVNTTLPTMPRVRPIHQKTPKLSKKTPAPAAEAPSTSAAPKSNNTMDPCPICMGE